jgi:hypothetical protein
VIEPRRSEGSEGREEKKIDIERGCSMLDFMRIDLYLDLSNHFEVLL